YIDDDILDRHFVSHMIIVWRSEEWGNPTNVGPIKAINFQLLCKLIIIIYHTHKPFLATALRTIVIIAER
ncbi:MAG TPA: hypothetical protein VFJ51_02085, partial [Nitrososphaeraceae archaeon]|nr:hypothetical protein [Nitrososphaeraceae archaeon]